MKLFLTILPFAILAAARPSPDMMEGALTGAGLTPRAVDCNPGQLYCFDQVVYNLGHDIQDLLHSYCADQYTIDALSCHGCTKSPQPMPNCTAAYPAWNSAFLCQGGQNLNFAKRCKHWCANGECLWEDQ